MVRSIAVILLLSSLGLMGYCLLRANALDACLKSLFIYDLSQGSSADKGLVAIGLNSS